MILEVIYYTVETIEGDYANLKRTEAPDEEPKLVARALLPEGIFEGCKVKYELMQYSMAD